MATAANKFRRTTTSSDTPDEERIEQVDFKMVTFSLAGKDYGIDIMKVKEIARFVNFTYVPNTPPYVRGVYNLRGEIISIIDLRGMFNLPHERKNDGEEEAGLILRLESNLIGVVVDKIDKVVGINSGHIQPPHPIFGDINIKYISGVVENEGRLYIILDVEKILSKPEETKTAPSVTLASPELEGEVRTQKPKAGKAQQPAKVDDDLSKKFIAEALAALDGFHLSSLNQDWFDRRYQDWKKERAGEDLQIRNKSEAEEYLRTFWSPSSGRLWNDGYGKDFIDSLPENLGAQIHVWNPGCGKGHETYAIAAAIRTRYPNSVLRIWASDKDLLSISSAPSLSFRPEEVPDWLRPFMVEGKNGLSFNQIIKDSILFEYHDVRHNQSMPPVQLVVARDILSFMPVDQARGVLQELADRRKGECYVCLGSNEFGNAEFGLSRLEGSPPGFSKLIQ